MKMILIPAACAAILAFSAGASMAQDRDHHDDGHAPSAPHAAPPHAAPAHAAPAGGHADAGRHGGGPAGAPHNPAPAARAMGGGNGRDTVAAPNRPQDTHSQNGGMRGPAPGNAMRGAANHPDYSRFNRNVRAAHQFHGPAYHPPSGWYAHRWTYGEILPPLFWAQNYWLNDYVDFGLDAPPPGTVWVRDGDDALLIDRYSGQIIEVEYSVFY